MSYLAYIAVLVVSFYTGLFALEVLKEKNYSGFCAIIVLLLMILALPFYYLFLKS